MTFIVQVEGGAESIEVNVSSADAANVRDPLAKALRDLAARVEQGEHDVQLGLADEAPAEGEGGG